MGDWADDAALKIVDKYVNTDPNTPRLVTLIDDIAAALRDAAAEGRRNAIERSAELIGRQVEARDAQ